MKSKENLARLADDLLNRHSHELNELLPNEAPLYKVHKMAQCLVQLAAHERTDPQARYHTLRIVLTALHRHLREGKSMFTSVFDAAGKVLEITRKTAAKCGVADRFSYVAGDLDSADFGTGHNVATLGHILHSEGEARSRALLQKTHGALAPGGTIVIAEFLVNADRRGPRAFPRSITIYAGSAEDVSLGLSGSARALTNSGDRKQRRGERAARGSGTWAGSAGRARRARKAETSGEGFDSRTRHESHARSSPYRGQSKDRFGVAS